MSNEIQNVQQAPLTTKSLFQKKSVQERFEALLDKKAQGFISSVLQVVNTNNSLSNAEPTSVLNAAITAATLDLPINQNLGFAWIIPFSQNVYENGQWRKKPVAQFQVGWKGYIQLALRTGQYKNINVIEVYQNQFKGFNRMSEELDADFNVLGEGDVVGYAAYFKLLNGFEKTCYWSKEEVIKHAGKYSQTYGKKNSKGKLISSPWNDESQFDSMAKKTVIKNTIAKWGIMSIEMQTAHIADQSTQDKEGNYNYPDNEPIDIEAAEASEEAERALGFIDKATTLEDLEMIEEGYPDMPSEVEEAIKAKKEQIKKAK
jgi:recombination protein RecT